MLYLGGLPDSLLEKGECYFMLIGIFPDAFSAETLLNNLSEADFDLNAVSVIMQDVKMRDKIAEDVGPFKGIRAEKIIEKLEEAGMTQSQSKLCADALAQSKVLVVMSVSEELISSAREMFTDQSAQIIKE
jgi:hypothetical protein